MPTSKREIVKCCLRGVAFIIFLLVLCILAAGVLHVLFDTGMERGWLILRNSFRWTLRSELSWSIPLCIVAIAMLVLQRPMARLIAGPLESGCPKCGYSLRNLKSKRCPECGSDLPQHSRDSA